MNDENDISSKRKIVAFRQDESGHWIANLECGHSLHVRHDPPWALRPWVTSEQGRQSFIGRELNCRECEKAALAATCNSG